MSLSEGELIVARVTEIGEFGATLRSDDYEGDIFLHISEIRLKREQRPTDALRKNQVLVVRVQKEDKNAKRLFVSLRGIGSSDSKKALRAWKEERGALSILKGVLARSGQPEELAQKIEERAVERFGSLSDAFRAILETGGKALSKLALPSETAEALEETLEKELLKKVYVERTKVRVFFLDPDGVEKLRMIGEKFSVKGEKGLRVSIKAIAPPEYELVIESSKPKRTRTVAQDMLKKLEDETKKLGGQFSA